MKAALQNYHARMQRVLDHIDRHLDDDLDLETMSGVAAFSKFHFHRQFTATFGVSVHRYVQLARMKRASHRLAYRDAQSVTDIAMDAGYDAPDAFARAFRQRFGQSPSSFRKSPDWEPWLAAFGPLDNARSKLMQTTYTPDDVTIRDVPPRRWRSWSIGATRRRSATPSSGSSPGARPPACTPDKPDLQCLAFRAASASPADYSMDLCVGTDRPIDANDASR
jgi:AraC family transcriptional regulator